MGRNNIMGRFSNPFRTSDSGSSRSCNPFRTSGTESRRRNPRFAPEGLESRLSPSTLGITTTAVVSGMTNFGSSSEPPPSPDGTPVGDDSSLPGDGTKGPA
jgi:hypothetical protein